MSEQGMTAEDLAKVDAWLARFPPTQFSADVTVETLRRLRATLDVAQKEVELLTLAEKLAPAIRDREWVEAIWPGSVGADFGQEILKGGPVAAGNMLRAQSRLASEIEEECHEQIRTLTEERDTFHGALILDKNALNRTKAELESLRAENERLKASTEVSEMAAMYARGLEDTATIAALRQQSERQRAVPKAVLTTLSAYLNQQSAVDYMNESLAAMARLCSEALAPAEPSSPKKEE